MSPHKLHIKDVHNCRLLSVTKYLMSASCYRGLDNQQMIDIDCTFPWFAFPCLTNISNNKTLQWHLNANEYSRILNGIASECLRERHWKQV